MLYTFFRATNDVHAHAESGAHLVTTTGRGVAGTVLESAKISCSGNLSRARNFDEEVDAFAHEFEDDKWFVFCPVRARSGVVLATILLVFTDEEHFTSTLQDRLSGFSSALAMDISAAVVNADNAAAQEKLVADVQTVQTKYKEITVAKRDTQRLLECSRRIHDTKYLDEIIDCVRKIGWDLFGAQHAVLYLTNSETGTLVSYDHKSGAQMEIPLGEGFIGKVAVAGEPLLLRAGDGDLAEHWARDLLCVPIFGGADETNREGRPGASRGAGAAGSAGAGGTPSAADRHGGQEKADAKVIGVLQIANKSSGSLDEMDMEVALGLADQLTISIHSANLLETMEEDLKAKDEEAEEKGAKLRQMLQLKENFEAYVHFLGKLRASDGVAAVFKAVRANLASVAGCEGVSIFIGSRHGGKMAAVREDGIEGVKVDVGKGLVGSCFLSGKTIAVLEARAREKFNASVDEQCVTRLRSAIYAPLYDSSRRICGVIQFANSTNSIGFEGTDMDFVGQLVNFVGAVVEESRSVEDMRRRIPILEKVVSEERTRAAALSERARSAEMVSKGSAFIHAATCKAWNDLKPAFVYELARRLGREMFNGLHTSFFVIDHAKRALSTIPDVGADFVSLSLDEGVIGECARSARTIVVTADGGGASESDLLGSYAPAAESKVGARGKGTGYTICIPVRKLGKKEQILGILQVVGSDEEAKGVHTLGAEMIAQHVSYAFELCSSFNAVSSQLEGLRAKLVETTVHVRERAEIDEHVRSVTMLLARLDPVVGNTAAMVYTISQHLPKLFNAEAATVFMAKIGEDKLWHFKADGSESSTFGLTQGVAAKCVSRGEMINLEFVKNDPSYDSVVDECVTAGLTSALYVPLLAQNGKCFGALQIANKRNGAVFTRNEEMIAQMLSAGLATALRSAISIRDAKARLAEMSSDLELNSRKMSVNTKENEALAHDKQAADMILREAQHLSKVPELIWASSGNEIVNLFAPLFKAVAQTAPKLFSVERAALFLVDQKDRELWTVKVDHDGVAKRIVQPLTSSFAAAFRRGDSPSRPGMSSLEEVIKPAAKTTHQVPIFSPGDKALCGILELYGQRSASSGLRRRELQDEYSSLYIEQIVSTLVRARAAIKSKLAVQAAQHKFSDAARMNDVLHHVERIWSSCKSSRSVLRSYASQTPELVGRSVVKATLYLKQKGREVVWTSSEASADLKVAVPFGEGVVGRCAKSMDVIRSGRKMAYPIQKLSSKKLVAVALLEMQSSSLLVADSGGAKSKRSEPKLSPNNEAIFLRWSSHVAVAAMHYHTLEKCRKGMDASSNAIVRLEATLAHFELECGETRQAKERREAVIAGITELITTSMRKESGFSLSAFRVLNSEMQKMFEIKLTSVVILLADHKSQQLKGYKGGKSSLIEIEFGKAPVEMEVVESGKSKVVERRGRGHKRDQYVLLHPLGVADNEPIGVFELASESTFSEAVMANVGVVLRALSAAICVVQTRHRALVHSSEREAQLGAALEQQELNASSIAVMERRQTRAARFWSSASTVMVAKTLPEL